MASLISRRALRAQPRATRSKPAFNYAESSSSDVENSEDEDEDEAAEIDRPPTPTRPRSTRNLRTTPQKRRRPTSSRSQDAQYDDERTVSKRRKTSRPSTPKKPTSMGQTQEIVGSGVIPPWQKLPYHVLVQIFKYATYPLYDDHTFQPLPSGKWLLSAARLCSAFAEPAFTVLYTTPPLVPMVQAHRLVDLLKADPLQLAYKYRQKVESLRIDVGQVVAYTLPGSGHLDLYGLIKDLPRLTDLEFYHQFDMAPYRDLDTSTSIKWTYPKAIFDALEFVDPNAEPDRGDKTSICKLRSWRWSSRLCGKKWPIEMIPEIHLKPSFASLQKIAFVNFQIPYLKKEEEDPKHENIIAKALNNLPSLEHLIFESSTLMNAKLLPMLPMSLRHLELVNCWEIIAEDFATFLLTHGSQLRCLTLNHNQSLSLSFLPVLGTACPKLQVIRVNLVYFNVHATYRDSEPQYDQLLLPDQVPVWPSTLQTIELVQMRKWETEAAEMFFQSLLDSAGSLSDLRKLSIQAILNIGWRDRASFRDKWAGSLARVFKSAFAPPQTVVSVRPIATASNLDAVAEVDLLERPKSSPCDNGSSSSSSTSALSLKYPPRKLSMSSSSSLSSINPQDVQTLIQKRLSLEPANEEGPAPARRSARASTRQRPTGIYTESPKNSSAEEEPDTTAARARDSSTRTVPRISKFEKELAILHQTAGIDSPAYLSSFSKTVSESHDSDEEPLARSIRSKGEGKAKETEFIQGMCEIVEVRIDNLRPTETQVTEADFLDEEAPGDEDWDGDEDDDAGYAW